jgi:hypothetical protein
MTVTVPPLTFTGVAAVQALFAGGQFVHGRITQPITASHICPDGHAELFGMCAHVPPLQLSVVHAT